MATTAQNSTKTVRASNATTEKRDDEGRFAKTTKPAAPKRTSGARARKDADDHKTETGGKDTTAKDNHGAGVSTGALWGAAAAGVAVGVAAMIGRKVAVQAPTLLAGDWDKALAAEHTAVLKIFDALEQTTTKNTGKRTIMLAQMKHALAKHALQEENVVYPALRDSGEIAGADQLNHEHGYVKQYLYELENTPKDSDTFLTILAKFRVDIEKHVREEEDVLYPALKMQLSEEANKQVTFAMNKEGFKLA